MNTNEAKRIRIEEYLHTLGYTPVRRQGARLWYKSPFRDEQEPSFKVNMERNLWVRFWRGQGREHHRTGAGTLRIRQPTLSLGTDSGAGTQRAPGLLLFWRATTLKTELPAVGGGAAFFPRPIVLSAAEGDKYGTGKKRMQGGALSDWRQTLLCRWFSQPFGRLRDTQQALQGLHSTEGHHPHTAGTAEGDLLPLRGLHGLPLLPHPAAGKVS